MSDIVIWIAAGLFAIAVVILFAVVPFSVIPRRPQPLGEPDENAVGEAQNEAELLYRRQTPVG